MDMDKGNNHDVLISSIAKAGKHLLEIINKEIEEISLLKKDEYDNKIKDKDFVSIIIDVVKSHKSYVENFFSVLVDNTDWVPPNYTECKFGKWYYSIDEEYIISAYDSKALTLFKKIGEYHKEFHEIGARVLDYYKSKDLQKVLALMPELSDKSRNLVHICMAFALSVWYTSFTNIFIFDKI